jgi:hypothetical protein
LRHYYAADDALPVQDVRRVDESGDLEDEQRIAERQRVLDSSLDYDVGPDQWPTLDV